MATSRRLRLNPEDVAANKGWLRDADIPDVLDWRDFHHSPSLTLGVLGEVQRDRKRNASDRMHYMKYPKPNGGERVFPVLNPIDELSYRNAVKPAACKLGRSIPANVFSRRTIRASGAFRAEPWRDARSRWNDWLKYHEVRDPGGGRGFLDVESCFGTIDRQRLLESTLPSLGCESYEIAPIAEFFEFFSKKPHGACGLPVGQEMSSLLGTAALVPVDRAAGDTPYARWVDDIVIPTHEPSEFYQGRVPELEVQLDRGGQVFNSAKTLWLPWSAHLEAGDYGGVIADVDGDQAAYVRLFNAAEAVDYEPVRAAIAELSKEQDERGMEVLQDFPWILERFPKRCASYAKQVWTKTDERYRAWVFDALELPDSSVDRYPLQMHLLRSFRKDLMREADHRNLLESGADLLGSRPAPLRFQMAASAIRNGGKHEWHDAIELAFQLTDLNMRRALLGELPFGRLKESQRRAVIELADGCPGLKPLAALASS